MDLIEQALAGDRLALSRLLTSIENQSSEGLRAFDVLYPHGGQAHVIGVTGGTGTGKSTLVNRLALQFRTRSDTNPRPGRVAIVAVDPTSPFSGGAILGDRIRMRDLSGDDGVFIRSMASRGALGGLALRTRPVVQALDAAGYSPILVETVGAGQSEVEVARLAHTTVVVEAPGLGDDVQAIKAGILEAADIVVVNKADLPGAHRATSWLKAALRLQNGGEEKGAGWQVPVLETIATEGQGITELAESLSEHLTFLQDTNGWKARQRVQVETELRMLLQDSLAHEFLEQLPQGQFDRAVNEVEARRLSPRQAVAQLMTTVET